MSWNSARNQYGQPFSRGGNDRSSSSRGGSMNAVPPPVELTLANNAARKTMTPYQLEQEKKKEEKWLNLQYNTTEETARKERKKTIYDDEYLERDDDDDDEDNDRLSNHKHRSDRDRSRDRARDHRKHRSSSHSKSSKKLSPKKEEEDEEDELDTFMNSINAQADVDKKESERKEAARAAGKDEIVVEKPEICEEDDMTESMAKFLEEYKQKEAEKEEVHEYDEDGNVIWTWKKVIDPLPALDHSTVEYVAFTKNFYKEHEQISSMSYYETEHLRKKLDIKVGGADPPKPVCSFGHFGFDKRLIEVIRKSEYEQPTPIQAQSIPAALSGRDVLGIAKTGSGKTAAYLWPAIVHIINQPNLQIGDGPIALVVVPTRELALQVFQEARKFCRAFNINVTCAYGGGSKWEQQNELKDGSAELVVCTPGRIIDLVKIEATNFIRVTFLVFDEADRMFDLGFEAQVMSISQHIRPDRQCLMFSATFRSKVERLAREALCNPVRIVQGEAGEANEDIQQHIHVVKSQDAKWSWLCTNLVNFCAVGKVLIFVTKKSDSEDVAARLRARDFKLVLLHGDMLQHERNEHLQAFRTKCTILVATDVAARGLDIPEIRTVINYDIARDIDTHVHRIGRTGRAGQKGDAHTLITEADKEFAGHLVKNLESVRQRYPQELLDLALKCQWFRNERGADIVAGGGLKIPGQTTKSGLGFVATNAPGGSKKEADPLKAHIPNFRSPVLVESTPSQTCSSTGSSAAPSSSTSSSTGPISIQNSRLTALKNAFKSSFSASFHRAQEPESELPPIAKSDPRPEWKRKLDDLNERIANGDIHKTQSSTDASKRSRWQ